MRENDLAHSLLMKLRPSVNVELSDVQLLPSRVTFHIHCVYFIYARKIYAQVEIHRKTHEL